MIVFPCEFPVPEDCVASRKDLISLLSMSSDPTPPATVEDIREEVEEEEADSHDETSTEAALRSLLGEPDLNIPVEVRPVVLEKWRRLRSNLDSSRPRKPGDPNRIDAGK